MGLQEVWLNNSFGLCQISLTQGLPMSNSPLDSHTHKSLLGWTMCASTSESSNALEIRLLREEKQNNFFFSQGL